MCGAWTLVLFGLAINTTYYQTLNLSLPCLQTEQICENTAKRIAVARTNGSKKVVPEFVCINRGEGQ